MISRHFAGHGALATLLLMAGCSSNSGGGGPAPVIASFTARPGSVATGSSTTLSWIVTNAAALSIDQGVGNVTGRSSVTTSPAADTTYTLTVGGVARSLLKKPTPLSVYEVEL